MMMKLALALSLMPSIAFAHPGHDEHVGAAHEAFISNPVLVLALFVGVALAFSRVARMVRK